MDEHFNPSHPNVFFSDYPYDEMEYDNTVPNDHGAIENISTRPAEFGDLFCVKFIPSIRQFKGQTSAPKNAELTVQSSTLEDFFEKVLEMVKPHIKGCISSSESGYELDSLADKELMANDLPNYILFYDETQKRNYNSTSITTKTLQSWKDKKINLYIHIYGLAVANKAIYSTVKEKLLDPVEKDKAGAASNTIVFDLMGQLKEIHRNTYRSKDFNWYEWASYIATEPPKHHEQLLNEPPPREMIRLFERAPYGSDHVLNEVRRNVNIAQTINAGQERDIQQLGRSIGQLKELFDACYNALTDLQIKYDAMMETNNNNNLILDSVQQSTRPVETERSRDFYNAVQNQEDLDHQ